MEADAEEDLNFFSDEPGQPAEDWDSDNGDDDGDWNVDYEDEVEEKQQASYEVIPDAKGSLQHEMDNIIVDVAQMLYLEEGQAEIALREYNWKRNALQKDWFPDKDDDGPLKMRKRLSLSLMEESSENEMVNKRHKCCSYAGLDGKSGNNVRKEMKDSQKELYSFVRALHKSGRPPAEILKHARAKKFKSKDVMKMVQIAISEGLASGSSTESISLCSKQSGMFGPRDGSVLNCGHGRCRDCWSGILKAAVRNGVDALTLKCNHLICKKKNCQHKYILGCFCTERIPREVFEEHLRSTPKLLEKYRRMCLKSFLDHADNFKLRPCPNPKCNNWLKKLTNKCENEVVVCDCGQKMCLDCGLSPHAPIPCSNALDWKKRSSADVQTEIWRIMNTATCPNPNCSVVIKREIDERDRCLHMVCTRCKYHWCWACREEFRPGGKNKNHDNFYHCKLYDEGKLRPEVKRQNEKLERIRREAANLKYCEHLRSCCDKDIKSLNELQVNLENEISRAQGDGSKFTFLFEAINKLIQASKDKKKLYIVAFYAAMDNKKELFEFQLKNMADKTNELLKMLQPNSKKRKSLEEFSKDGPRIHSITKTVQAFLQKLRKSVQDGKCVTILEKPDAKSTGWFCMNCKRLNSFDRFICECKTCQVHGEARCLRCNPESHVHYID